MPETRMGARPHPSRSCSSIVVVLILVFLSSFPAYSSYPRAVLRASIIIQRNRDGRNARRLTVGKRIYRQISSKTDQHFYDLSLAKNELVYVTITRTNLLLDAEVFAPGGSFVARHRGNSQNTELAFSIHASLGGVYSIKLVREDKEGQGSDVSGSYVIGVTVMPLLKVNGQSIRGNLHGPLHYYGLNLKAEESVYLEITAKYELNFMVFDPQNKMLEDKTLGTHLTNKGVVSSMFVHARTSGLYRVELLPNYDSVRKPMSYSIRADVSPLLKQGGTYDVALGNNLFSIKLAAGQLFHAEVLGDMRGDRPYIYIQDPNDNFRKPLVEPSGPRLSIVFIASATGRYGVGVHKSTVTHSFKYKLNVKEVRTASSKDKTDFAVRSCSPNPSPRDRGTAKDELRFFDTCFYGLSVLVADKHSDVVHLSASLYEDVTLMARKWDKKSVTSLYRRSLDAIHNAFEVAKNSPDRDKVYSILNDIAADLKIKAEHCKRSKTGKGLGDPIRLVVVTILDGAPVKGYLVFCVPTLEEYRSTSPPIQFDRPSDPEAEKVLPPGEYKVWGEKSRGQRMMIKNSVQVDSEMPTQRASIYVP